MTIKKIPLQERPRERCLKNGAHVLSLRECLAVLLAQGPKGKGCLGLAEDILNRVGQRQNTVETEEAFFKALSETDKTFLEEISGLGKAKKAALLASLEIAKRYSHYRLKQTRKKSKKKIMLSKLQKESLKKIEKNFRAHTKEWVGFVPVMNNGSVGSFCLVAEGNQTKVGFDLKDFFAKLLVLKPFGYILFHNHPSGDLDFSEEDRLLTASLSTISGQLQVKLIDHCVVTSESENWLHS